MMAKDIERFHRIEACFEGALLYPAGPERDAYLTRECDAELLAEVQQLLADDAQVSAAVPFTAEALPEFGAWQAIRLLGRGGMGVVYLAERADGAFKMRVAVKVVPLALASVSIEERFRRERQFLASLEHPKIARLIDGGLTSAGLPYLVMEFVDGQAVDRYCQTHQLDSRSRVELMRQVLEALEYVHSRRVIHRDIKPSNILVDSSGNAKLLDFGTARLVDVSGDAEITKTGIFAFTPEYASPEQAAGKPLEFSSDIYSAGVLFYRLLTGRAPYAVPGHSPAGVAETISQTEPAPAALDDSPLEAILATALRKHPAERYQTAAEMDADLQRYLEGKPVLARRPQSWRGIAIATVAAFTLISVGSAWLFHRPRPPREPVAIAVLPFSSSSNEKADQYFADTLTQEVAGGLLHNKALRVSPQTAVAVFRKQPRDVRNIGKKIQVSHLLEAGVERSGDHVKIVASLERTSDGAKIWANTYQRKTADLGAIEADLEAGVASTLGIPRSDPSKSHVPPEPARELFLKGSFAANGMDTKSNALAQQYFRRAVEADPEYATAYNSLAIMIWQRNIVAGERPVMEERRDCEKLWRKALQLDPDLRGARVSLSLYAMQYDWDWKRAERELQTVLSEGPYAAAEDIISFLYLIQGRRAEANRHRRIAQDLDYMTFSLSLNNMIFLRLEGRFVEAREECLKLIARNPGVVRWQIQLNGFDFLLGRTDSAIQNLRKLSQQEPGALMPLAEAEAMAGHRKEALLILRPLERNWQNGKIFMGDFAAVYAALGDEPNTVKWLERAMEAREAPVIYLHIVPAFAKMQDTPEFHRLKKRMNLDW